MNNIKVIETRRDNLRRALDKITVELQAANDEILTASPERLQAVAVERIQLEAQQQATAAAFQEAESQYQQARAQLETPEYKRLKKQTTTAGQDFAQAAQAARDAMQAAYEALQTAQEKQTAYKALVKQDIALSPEQQHFTWNNADAKSLQVIASRLAPYMEDVKTAASLRLFRQELRNPQPAQQRPAPRFVSGKGMVYD